VSNPKRGVKRRFSAILLQQYIAFLDGWLATVSSNNSAITNVQIRCISCHIVLLK
jgi:hypothetical protein